ncbi:hypothetical protein EK904_013391 [Melospiza melodia maxima]|nr:hypothetical protein EK904_013391 [Melospiza melodia maxima]
MLFFLFLSLLPGCFIALRKADLQSGSTKVCFLFKCSFKDSHYKAPCFLRAEEQALGSHTLGNAFLKKCYLLLCFCLLGFWKSRSVLCSAFLSRRLCSLMRLWVCVAGVLGEAWGAVSMCVRGELPAFHLSVRDECEFQSRGSVVVELGRKASLKATRNLRLSFWGSKNVLHMVVKSSLLFFPLKIGTFSVILYKSFRSNSMGFGAGTAFGNMGVSVHRAEVPIKKFKNISNCPNQGSLSVAFTNASVFGSQFAASVAICACAWETKEKQKDRNNQPPQPVVDSNAEEPQTAERLWPAVQRATLQHRSTSQD